MERREKLLIGILASIIIGLPAYAGDYKPGELIVKFKSPASPYSAAMGAQDTRPVTVAVDDTETALAELRERPDVEYAEPNYVIEAEDVPSDWPYSTSLWTDTQLPQAWDLLSAAGPGAEVIIAVVDSGVDLDHQDLAGILTTGYDFANNDSVPDDDAGHGTRVCGIIGALGNNGGVAGLDWNINVSIMPLKFMKLNGGSTTGNVSDAVEAIYYAVDHGADIINASWGFTSYSSSLADAISYARDHGVLFFASAGNSGANNDTTDHYPSNYTMDNVIAVAALSTNGQLASFSNYGAASVDVAAPGVGLSSTDSDGGYVSYISGTSYSTPFVAAIAAMVKSQAPDISYRSLRSIVINSAVSGEGASLDNIASGGCVDAYQALVAEQSGSYQTGNPSDTASSEGGGGGGGGCLMDASRNPGSPAIILIILTLAALFRMPRTSRPE
jgi:subtilisin family serine protease